MSSYDNDYRYEVQRLRELTEIAERQAATAAAQAVRYRAAYEHGLRGDDLDFLGTGSEDEIAARAQRIAAKNAAIAEATRDA